MKKPFRDALTQKEDVCIWLLFAWAGITTDLHHFFSSSWPLATFSGSNMILTFVHKIESKSTNVCMCLLQDDKQGTPTVTQPRLPRYVKKQCLLTAWVNWGMYIIEVANHWAPFLSSGLISFPVESTLVQVLLFLLTWLDTGWCWSLGDSNLPELVIM